MLKLMWWPHKYYHQEPCRLPSLLWRNDSESPYQEYHSWKRFGPVLQLGCIDKKILVRICEQSDVKDFHLLGVQLPAAGQRRGQRPVHLHRPLQEPPLQMGRCHPPSDVQPIHHPHKYILLWLLTIRNKHQSKISCWSMFHFSFLCWTATTHGNCTKWDTSQDGSRIVTGVR